MGGEVAVWGPVDDNESISAIQRGLDLGITLLDTAPAYGYGHSEEVVGKALAGRRDRVVLATKCGLVWRDPGGAIERRLSPKSVMDECAASLRRLRVETIDLYQIHWPDPNNSISHTMEALVRLREQGKIRVIGVSNFTHEQIAEARKYGPVECLQPELSMFERSALDELLPYAREYRQGVVVYGPLARGLLTGKFTVNSRFTDLRSKDVRFSGPNFSRNLKTLDRLRVIAQELKCTLPQLALSWVIHQDGVSAAISGVKRPTQVVENAGAADVLIPPTLMDEINAILAERE